MGRRREGGGGTSAEQRRKRERGAKFGIAWWHACWWQRRGIRGRVLGSGQHWPCTVVAGSASPWAASQPAPSRKLMLGAGAYSFL